MLNTLTKFCGKSLNAVSGLRNNTLFANTQTERFSQIPGDVSLVKPDTYQSTSLSARATLPSVQEVDEECSNLEALVSLIENPRLHAPFLAPRILSSLRQCREPNRLVDGLTPFHWAVKSNNPNKVEALLAYKLRTIDVDKGMPIFDAIKQKNSKIVGLLIEADAHLNVLNRKGRSPIQQAIETNAPDIVKALLKTGKVDFELGCKEQATLLHQAAAKAKPAIIEALVDAGLDINLPNLKGYTPLHIAAKANNTNAAKALLEIDGINPNVQSHLFGDTPLHFALVNGNMALAEKLLTHEKINLQKQGKRALLLAQKYCPQAPQIQAKLKKHPSFPA